MYAIRSYYAEVLEPWFSWSSREEYNKRYEDLAMRFVENFAKFEEGTPREVVEAGPKAKDSVITSYSIHYTKLYEAV